MGEKHRKIRLDLNELENIVNSWGTQNGYNATLSIENRNKQVINYCVTYTNIEAKFALYPDNSGLYTISPNVGSNREISAKIVEYIVESTGALAEANKYKNGITIPMEKEDYLTLCDLICEKDEYFLSQKNNKEQGDIICKISDRDAKENVALTYYHTNKIVLQGKDSKLYRYIVDILSSEGNLEKVFGGNVKHNTIIINGLDVVDEMKQSLGKAYDFLASPHKASLAWAYIQYRTEFDITSNLPIDYSGITNSAAKVIEGYIFKLIAMQVPIDEEAETIGYYFNNKKHQNPLKMKEQYACNFDENFVKIINNIYFEYCKLRHQYSHTRENEALTAIISDRKIADRYFEAIIDLIRNSYNEIYGE